MGLQYLLRKQQILSGMALLLIASSVSAMDPKFELGSQELSLASGSGARSERRISQSRKPVSEAPQGVVHTVRAGDNIFKILIREYGLSNNEAEACIEEIRRENNIYDIKRLRVGQKITIPMLQRKADGTVKKVALSSKFSTAPLGQSLTLDSPVERLTEQDSAQRVRRTWDTLVPSQKEDQKPISLSSAAFSLTLDPQRYPVYSALDGGKILVDSSGTIPPLVKSLITEKDPTIKIISESPASNRSFLTSLLNAAGFYSVEENFSMEFGIDPKLTVNADFKIEKTKNSLMNQDLTLINAGRDTMPPSIVELLKKEGFSIHEPFASHKTYLTGTPRQIYQITAKNQPEIVDAMLAALSISPFSDKQMDVFAADNNGISLSVKAERYFENAGKRYVVTRFDGDPITYTLFRILETKGFNVVILEQKDDFKKISEKLLARMGLNGSYRQHTLVKNGSSSYSLQMSGFMLDQAKGTGNSAFFTNLAIDNVIRDVLKENGYTVVIR